MDAGIRIIRTMKSAMDVVGINTYNDMRYLKTRYLFWAFIIGSWLFVHPTIAQELPAGIDASFRIASMNPLVALQKGDAVVRLDNQQLEIKSRNKATWRVHRAITIYNASGRDHGIIGYGYDKFRKPKKLAGQIRNAEGKVIRKLKKNEIEDYSAISDISLYDDSRVRVARLEHTVYPYTIEYWYELDFNGYISWPSWTPESAGLAVEHARYEVQAPEQIKVRYQLEGENMEPQVFADGKKRIYRWEVTALRTEIDDLLAALSVEFVPEGRGMRVKIAPESFEIEGAVGDMRSWASFGSWYYGLNKGRDILPQDKASEMQRLVERVPDPIDRAKKIYDLFQSSTRYVSVQLGIGGWQTFDAAYVAERGYGDCKALTNYLKALLAAAHIRAYPALIHSSRRGSDVDKDFPNNEFNHVILMVPLEADTLWLEATSQVIPFGRIGASNEDRYALAVKPSGGELVRTPASAASQNVQLRTATVALDASGDATASLALAYAGNQQDRITHTLVGAPHRDRMEWLRGSLGIPAFEVVSADFSEVKARENQSRITVDLKLPRYASRIGSRLFLPTNLLDRQTYVPPENDNRTKPVVIAYAYLDEDVVKYTIPAGFRMEAMPEDVEIETSFAKYTATHLLEANALTYTRILEFKQREIEANMYDSYRGFMQKVAKADRAQVVLVEE